VCGFRAVCGGGWSGARREPLVCGEQCWALAGLGGVRSGCLSRAGCAGSHGCAGVDRGVCQRVAGRGAGDGWCAAAPGVGGAQASASPLGHGHGMGGELVLLPLFFWFLFGGLCVSLEVRLRLLFAGPWAAYVGGVAWGLGAVEASGVVGGGLRPPCVCCVFTNRSNGV